MSGCLPVRHNHLAYFLANLQDRKVLSHEHRRLAGEDYDELAAELTQVYLHGLLSTTTA